MKIVNVFVLHFVILLYINIVLFLFKNLLNEGINKNINKNKYYTFHKFLFVFDFFNLIYSISSFCSFIILCAFFKKFVE